MSRKHAAFTLIELLVVIASMAVLAAILFPVFARVRDKARQTTCVSNLKQIAAGALMYMQDYDERFLFVLDYSGNDISGANYGDDGKHPWVPGVTGLEPEFQFVTMVARYVRNRNVWYCPAVGPDFVWEAWVKSGGWKNAPMRDQGTTYAYNYVAGNRDWSRQTFMGAKSNGILGDASRWPMLFDEPGGFGFTGNVTDPPTSVMPHSGGLNIAYGDGHAKYHHLEKADGNNLLLAHAGDGLYPGQ